MQNLSFKRVQFYHALLLFTLILTGVLQSRADDVVVDNIIYTIDDGYAIVKGLEDSTLTTDLNILASVEYNDVTYPVTEIKYSAFYQCADLKSVTIPDSVIEIGAYAFNRCSDCA
jgi:hypothetical protein